VWYSFPWERMKGDTGPQDSVRRILQYIGEDPEREGLVETPNRVVKSFAELYKGYQQDPKDFIKTFESSCNEMVILTDIDFTSTCEHHLLAFVGKASIAYIPDGRVIGVSKLVRILETYSRRLQIQERLCEQIVECLMLHLKPKGAACLMEASHLCMACRGVQKINAKLETSCLRGVFLTDSSTKAEFLSRAQQ